MGVNMVSVNKMWHYGAPASLEVYLQESSRGGRQANSVVFWKPAEGPLCRDQRNAANAELAAVRLPRKYIGLQESSVITSL